MLILFFGPCPFFNIPCSLFYQISLKRYWFIEKIVNIKKRKEGKERLRDRALRLIHLMNLKIVQILTKNSLDEILPVYRILTQCRFTLVAFLTVCRLTLGRLTLGRLTLGRLTLGRLTLGRLTLWHLTQCRWITGDKHGIGGGVSKVVWWRGDE